MPCLELDGTPLCLDRETDGNWNKFNDNKILRQTAHVHMDLRFGRMPVLLPLNILANLGEKLQFCSFLLRYTVSLCIFKV